MTKAAKGQANISVSAYRITQRLTSQNNASSAILKTQRGAFEKVAMKLYTKPSNKLVTGK
jgi:hypothetical protein